MYSDQEVNLLHQIQMLTKDVYKNTVVEKVKFVIIKDLIVKRLQISKKIGL